MQESKITQSQIMGRALDFSAGDPKITSGFVEGAEWAVNETVIKLMHLIRSGKVKKSDTNMEVYQKIMEFDIHKQLREQERNFHEQMDKLRKGK